MYRLICPKPAHFLSAQMALVSTFFQMFIVLGMYNFEHVIKWKRRSPRPLFDFLSEPYTYQSHRNRGTGGRIAPSPVLSETEEKPAPSKFEMPWIILPALPNFQIYYGPVLQESHWKVSDHLSQLGVSLKLEFGLSMKCNGIIIRLWLIK